MLLRLSGCRALIFTSKYLFRIIFLLFSFEKRMKKKSMKKELQKKDEEVGGRREERGRRERERERETHRQIEGERERHTDR